MAGKKGSPSDTFNAARTNAVSEISLPQLQNGLLRAGADPSVVAALSHKGATKPENS